MGKDERIDVSGFTMLYAIYTNGVVVGPFESNRDASLWGTHALSGRWHIKPIFSPPISDQFDVERFKKDRWYDKDRLTEQG